MINQLRNSKLRKKSVNRFLSGFLMHMKKFLCFTLPVKKAKNFVAEFMSAVIDQREIMKT